MKDEVRNLKYIILPGQFPQDKAAQDLHNKSYLFWKNFWNKVFSEKGTNPHWEADTIWRQDLIGLLVHEDRIVAQLLFTFFDCRSLAAREHSYFLNSFNDEFFKRLEEKKANYIMTMESLAIEPDWRKQVSGISLSGVMLSLTSRHIQEFECDASVAAVRTNSAVPSVIKNVGGETLVSGIELYEEPGELMAIFRNKIKKFPDLDVQRLSEKLWNERWDVTQDIPVVQRKKAA
jgi:hypothetical protein